MAYSYQGAGVHTFVYRFNTTSLGSVKVRISHVIDGHFWGLSVSSNSPAFGVVFTWGDDTQIPQISADFIQGPQNIPDSVHVVLSSNGAEIATALLPVHALIVADAAAEGLHPNFALPAPPAPVGAIMDIYNYLRASGG